MSRLVSALAAPIFAAALIVITASPGYAASGNAPIRVGATGVTR